MKKSILKSLIFIVCYSAALSYAASINSKQDILFVQTSHKATLEAVPNKPNAFKLTLIKANPYLTYFSNRPTRVTGIMSSSDFLRYWQNQTNSFSNDVPNASLVAYDRTKPRGHRTVEYVVELTQPSYDTQKQTFTYIIHNLNSKQSTLPKLARFSHIALFVDQMCLSCIG